MKAGDTFWLKDRSVEGGHSRFVLSDPALDEEHVVIASLTEWHANKDQACILEAGDDAIVKKRSIVSFRDATIAPNAYLDEHLANGMLISGPPLSPATLARIRAGCALTRHIPNDAYDVLDQQGLIPVV